MSELPNRFGPGAVVGVPLVFNLWNLRRELLPVWRWEDGAIHTSMIRWALGRLRDGHVPLDGWFPSLGLGFPLFHHYQSLPHIVSAYVARGLGVEHTYSFSMYLLLATWPISVYMGARLLRWDRWTSSAAAVISPLLASPMRFGYEFESYIFAGPNLWPQLWAMWLVPIAWGLSWRSISSGTRYTPAAVVCGLVVACHFLTGYLTVLLLAVFALLRPSELIVRVKRVLIVGSGAVLVAAWVVVPILQDGEWVPHAGGRGAIAYAGVGRRLQMLFTGQAFDMRRFPVISLLVLVGVAVCLMRWRSDERPRAALAAGSLSLMLFVGRSAWSPLTYVLPFGGNLILRRYLMGVHMAGIVIAGVGAVWLVRVLLRWIRRMSPEARPVAVVSLLAAVAVLVLAPAMAERERVAAKSGRFVRVERARERTTGADFAELAGRTGGEGRIYAPVEDYWITVLSARLTLANLGANVIGYTHRLPSLAGRVQQYFDDANPAHYDLFDARFVILPVRDRPAVPAAQIASNDNYRLWKVPTSGYFKLVDTQGSVAADQRSFRAVMREFVESKGPERGLHPTVSFDGRTAGPSTIGRGQTRAGPRGRIEREEARPDDGVFDATVTSPRTAVVMLKSSYHPRWTATVDGRETRPFMVAPGFVAQVVPPGTHDIAFRYDSYPHYVWLFFLAAAAIAVLVVIDRRTHRRAATVAPSPRVCRGRADG